MATDLDFKTVLATLTRGTPENDAHVERIRLSRIKREKEESKRFLAFFEARFNEVRQRQG